MGRFESTVGHYVRAREPYGPAFFATVAERLAFHPASRLLDLGTGPGLLALGFAPFVGDLFGVDPEPAMLAEARAAATERGVALRLVAGRAEDVPESLGRFDVVTIGRALHWMVPDPTRAMLARVVEPDGVVLICRASSVADERNPWRAAYRAASARWTDPPGAEHHVREAEPFFAGTAFRRRETIAVETRHRVSVEHLVERVLSRSSSSPARVGSGVPALRADIGAALAPFAQHGFLSEVVEARAEVFGRAG